MKSKKQGNKPRFRSEAKRAAYEYLENQLKEVQKKLRRNRFEIAILANQQKELKSDVAGLHQVIQEYNK